MHVLKSKLCRWSEKATNSPGSLLTPSEREDLIRKKKKKKTKASSAPGNLLEFADLFELLPSTWEKGRAGGRPNQPQLAGHSHGLVDPHLHLSCREALGDKGHRTGAGREISQRKNSCLALFPSLLSWCWQGGWLEQVELIIPPFPSSQGAISEEVIFRRALLAG